MDYWSMYFINFTLLFLFINVILYEVNFKKISISLYWFTNHLILGLIIQITSIIFSINEVSNLPLLHFYTLIEFIILSIFYKKVLKNESWFQKWIPYIIGIGSLLIIANSIFIQSIFTFNSNAKAMSQIIIMGYAISYYFSILHKNTTTDQTLNLLNAAILLYYAGSFFIFMFSNVLLKNQSTELLKLFFDFNILLYLIFQLLVLFAGWRKLYYTTKS